MPENNNHSLLGLFSSIMVVFKEGKEVITALSYVFFAGMFLVTYSNGTTAEHYRNERFLYLVEIGNFLVLIFFTFILYRKYIIKPVIEDKDEIRNIAQNLYPGMLNEITQIADVKERHEREADFFTKISEGTLRRLIPFESAQKTREIEKITDASMKQKKEDDLLAIIRGRILRVNNLTIQFADAFKHFALVLAVLYAIMLITSPGFRHLNRTPCNSETERYEADAMAYADSVFDAGKYDILKTKSDLIELGRSYAGASEQEVEQYKSAFKYVLKQLYRKFFQPF